MKTYMSVLEVRICRSRTCPTKKHPISKGVPTEQEVTNAMHQYLCGKRG
jgi:hypothetical protein